MIKTYEPNWNSLGTHPNPQWFKDAKFGIYTHWGPYCVPSYGWNASWYTSQMYDDPEKSGIARHHRENYGHPGEFGYKDFIPINIQKGTVEIKANDTATTQYTLDNCRRPELEYRWCLRL